MDQFEFWWMQKLLNFRKESLLDDEFESRAGGHVQIEDFEVGRASSFNKS